MRSDWKQPPGTSGVARSAAATSKKVLGSFLVGVISIGSAWAGTALVPVKGPSDDRVVGQTTAPEGKSAPTGGTEDPTATLAGLDEGQLLAGAAKISIKPRPDDYGGVWQKDNCRTLPNETPNEDNWQEYPGHIEETVQNNLHNATHVADFRVRWNEHSNCIYMGGYGLGPMFPITDWDDEYGLWARSVAVSDGSDTVVLTLLDAVYWEGRYNSMCSDCGFLDLADQLAAQTGLRPESFVFASTHSHTAPDFIGGWGGVPPWYMKQVTDSLKAAATEALLSMRPAVLESGETIARQFNGERRDFYRSAEDDGVSWFRLIEAPQPDPQPTETPTPTPTPTPTFDPPGHCNSPKKAEQPECRPPAPTPAPTPTAEPEAPTVIATVGAYAAHPVTADAGGGRADADFPAVFAKRVEEAFGGMGMFLQTGLGNMSPRGKKLEMGNGLARQVPAVGSGVVESNPDVRVGRAHWDQPVTNIPLGTLGVTGFFDRKFNETPAAVRDGKGAENKRCNSASPVSVDTSVSAVKIGRLWITGAPGEIFANFSNTIEERNPAGVTLALGLVNDGLGYIIQSFETDHVGRQGVGFAGSAGPVGLAEYEDAYSIDHCFGDAALEKTISLLGSL